MKKWGILALVVLCGLLLLLRFFSKRAEEPAPVESSQTKEEPVGVALPDNPAGQPPASAPDAASYSSDAGDYNDLMLPRLATQYEGACKGGSLEEMRTSHGRYWGYFAKHNPLSSDETKKMYDYMAAYVACSAVARHNNDMCGSLPGETNSAGIKVDSKMSLLSQCKKKTIPVLFSAYMAGKVKDSNFCYSSLSWWTPKAATKMSKDGLCAAAAKGMAATRDYILQAMPNQKRRVDTVFPDSKSACSGDSECLNNLATYEAIKSGNASGCPRGNAAFCEAVVTKTPVPCEAIVRDMSKYYCGAVARVSKASNGYIGLNPSEVAFEIAKAEQVKKEADRVRKISDKNMEEINKRVKAMKKKSE